MDQQVAFIGLGNMGFPMAKNLLRNKVSLFVFNRSPEKASYLVQEGAVLLKNPKEAFQKANIVFSMLANDKALEEVLLGENGLLESAKPGSIHVSMSTIAPETSHKFEALFRKKGAYYLAAPVFGRPEAAVNAKLVICLAGNLDAKRKVELFLHLLGQRIEDFGEDAKNANFVKIAGNFMLLSAIETMGEAFALVENNGLEKEKVAAFFFDTLFACPAYKTYGNVVTSGVFEPPGLKMSLGLKDMTLVQNAAKTSQTNMPFLNQLIKLLQQGIAEGKENSDWAAITQVAQEEKANT